MPAFGSSWSYDRVIAFDSGICAEGVKGILNVA
jgi:hypothetical protein